jgi:hypothetical protein
MNSTSAPKAGDEVLPELYPQPVKDETQGFPLHDPVLFKEIYARSKHPFPPRRMLIPICTDSDEG